MPRSRPDQKRFAQRFLASPPRQQISEHVLKATIVARSLTQVNAVAELSHSTGAMRVAPNPPGRAARWRTAARRRRRESWRQTARGHGTRSDALWLTRLPCLGSYGAVRGTP